MCTPLSIFLFFQTLSFKRGHQTEIKIAPSGQGSIQEPQIKKCSGSNVNFTRRDRREENDYDDGGFLERAIYRENSNGRAGKEHEEDLFQKARNRATKYVSFHSFAIFLK